MSIHTQIDLILNSIVFPLQTHMQKADIKTTGVTYVR